MGDEQHNVAQKRSLDETQDIIMDNNSSGHSSPDINIRPPRRTKTTRASEDIDRGPLLQTEAVSSSWGMGLYAPAVLKTRA